MDINNKHFGRALKSYMKRKHIVVVGFAKEMGVYPKSIYDAFKVEQPRPETLKKYLALLNITEEELYGIKESSLSTVQEESPTYRKAEPKKTIEIPVSDFEYFMNALKELDAFKAKELERQQQELEKLQEANRVKALPVKQ